MIIELLLDEDDKLFSIEYQTFFVDKLEDKEFIDTCIEQGIFDKDIDGFYFEDIVYQT